MAICPAQIQLVCTALASSPGDEASTGPEPVCENCVFISVSLNCGS